MEISKLPVPMGKRNRRLVETLEMPQSSRDKVLWIHINNGRKMKRSDLRRRVSMRLADLEPILEELVKDGRIRISSRSLVSLNEG